MLIFENLGNYARIYSKVSFRILFLWEVLWGFSTMCIGSNSYCNFVGVSGGDALAGIPRLVF